MKKGFTLIEMIGSIMILAMIALVAFPAVLNLLNSSQDKIDDGVKNYIIGAAREYVGEHINCYPKNSNVIMPPECEEIPNINNNNNLTVSFLVNKGYANEKSITDEMKNDYILVTTETKSGSAADEKNYEYTVYKYEYKEVS